MNPFWEGPFRGDSGDAEDMTYWSWKPVEDSSEYEVVASVYDDAGQSPDVLVYNPHNGYDSYPWDGDPGDIEALLSYAEELWDDLKGNYDEIEDLWE